MTEIDLDGKTSVGATNISNIEAAEFPSVQSLIKKFDGLSGRTSPKSFPLVSKQLKSVPASPRATSSTEVSFEGKAAKDYGGGGGGSDASASGDLDTSTNDSAKEADLALIKSENVPNDGDEFLSGMIKNDEEVVSKLTSAASDPRQDCLEAAVCTDDESALEELFSPLLECDEQRTTNITTATPVETSKGNAKSEAEPKAITETVSAEEAVELEELAKAEARDDSEKSNEQVATDACAESTGDGGDMDLFVEAVEVLNELNEGIVAPEITEDASIFASAPASASGSESASSLASVSATALVAAAAMAASSSSEEAPVLPQKISVRVVSGQRKQPKKLRHQRGCTLAGILAAGSDSMTAVSPKKRRPLLSNCARTLKNKVLDASRTMMSLVSLRTDESASSGRSKHHQVSASAPASLSPSSAVPSPATTSGNAATLQSPSVLSSEEEPLLPLDSAEHQENNSALNGTVDNALPGPVASACKENAATTDRQRERLQPATLSLQLKDASSAARMSFTFVAKRLNSTPVAANFSQSDRFLGSLETAAFFAFGELDADVSMEVAEMPTVAVVSVPGRPMFSRLVKRYEVN